MNIYSKYSDNELTDLLKSGDRYAFTEIYNRYWGIMYAHVYKMLRDEEEAKDVIQEIRDKKMDSIYLDIFLTEADSEENLIRWITFFEKESLKTS